MIYDYCNYKGGTNNLCIVYEHLNPYINGVTGRSTKGLEQAFKNFKRNYKKFYGVKYTESVGV